MADRPLVLDDFLPFRLSFTSNLVSESIAREYESLFGISIPEWRIVTWVAQSGVAQSGVAQSGVAQSGVAQSGGITQQAIGARARMDKVTVSRAAIALVERGLLSRAPNPDDRRSHVLTLTAAGEELYAAIAPKALSLEDRIFAGFSTTELAQFTAMLRRIDAVTLALDPAGEH